MKRTTLTKGATGLVNFTNEQLGKNFYPRPFITSGSTLGDNFVAKAGSMDYALDGSWNTKAPAGGWSIKRLGVDYNNVVSKRGDLMKFDAGGNAISGFDRRQLTLSRQVSDFISDRSSEYTVWLGRSGSELQPTWSVASETDLSDKYLTKSVIPSTEAGKRKSATGSQSIIEKRVIALK